jgi:transposase-like protein
LSKTKNKNRSEIEVLRGENRSLRKELKQLRKQARIVEDKEDDIQLELEGFSVYQESPKKTYCPSCKIGEFKMAIDLSDKTIYNCTECDFKRVTKK